MKIRIASSIALAAALALGATGCSLIAPQGTTVPYAPSDGVDVNVAEGVDVRNILLIEDETGENLNVVFTAMNRTGQEQDLSVKFVAEGGNSATAEFALPAGTTAFGNPEGEFAPVLVTIDGVAAGATVPAYFQAAGAPEAEHNVPVLDGTLLEYQDYVLPAGFAAVEEVTAENTDESAKAEAKTEAEEAEAN